MAKLGAPINRDECLWLPGGQCLLQPYQRDCLSAAYLQPPNFIPNAEDAYNYGTIGSTIGHEIGHGFDDYVASTHAHGNLKSWWTEEDRKQFEKRTRGLIDQYNRFQPLPGLFVNGKLTLGENIGDLGGTSIALKAYRMSLKGKPSPVIDGFSGEERFFGQCPVQQDGGATRSCS